MQTLNLNVGEGPPDLLKRFMPTPFRGTLHLGGAEVSVQSNDSTIVDHFVSSRRSFSVTSCSFLWKLVYDYNAPSELLPGTIITCGPTVFATLGPACLVGFDHDRSELVAFLGIHGNDPSFHEAVLPFLAELTLEAMAVVRSNGKAVVRVATMGDLNA